MRKVSMRIAKIALLCVALLVAAIPSPSLAQDTEDTTLAARLDALAEGFMLREQVPGAIAMVVSGETTILRGYGHSDIEADIPVSPDGTRFEIGSVTKLFTWVAVMMLVEEGRLDLKQDLAMILPAGLVPGDAPLTMAHLMSHRPGFDESYAIFDQAIADLPRIEALFASAPEQVFPRGEVTAYSNWGVALAGLVVEEITGEPWESFVETRILGPLGMEDTTTGEARRGADQPPLASSYRLHNGIVHPAFRIDIGAFAPAGGIASTASDMARFLRFLMSDGALDGVRLLRPETMTAMRTRLFDDRPRAADMAHGLQSRPMFGPTVYGHGGGLNEFLSNLVFIPEIDAGVFISQNGGMGASLVLLVPDLILAELAEEAGLTAPEPTSAPAPVPAAAQRAAEAAGRYYTTRRPYSGWAQIFGALTPLTVTASPDGDLMLATGKQLGLSRFEPIARDLWQTAQGDRIAVLRDADGRITALADGTGAHTHERVQGLGDPLWLYLSFGMAALLSVTTLMGLVWRHGLGGGTRMGTVAASIAVAAAAGVWVLIGIAVAVVLAVLRLGSEYLFDQPQATLQAALLTSDAVVVAAGLLVASSLLALRAPGWVYLRRLLHCTFALAMALFAGLLLRWGLAFGGPI